MDSTDRIGQTYHPATDQVGKRLPKVSRVAALVFFLLAALCYGSYRADRARLRAVAQELTAEAASPSDRVLRLLYWVYHNDGFTSNDRYFLFRRLGATPVQVLEDGGDCADKSRLLSAMLREVGIPSTMAMCFDVASGKSTHTVVEARVGPTDYMVVDPVYNLHFPRRDSTGFHGLLDLRRDASILPRRLDELSVLPGRTPIPAYNRASSSYAEASSINWGKNRATRISRDVLISIWGDEVYRFRRPVVLEEPKLAVAWTSAAIGAGVLLFGAVGRSWRSARRRKEQAPCAVRGRARRTVVHPNLAGSGG